MRPNADLTFRLCAPYTALPLSQFAARQMVAIRRCFLLTQLEVEIVMAFKLCQEGNWEPLIRRIAFNALLENALLE